MGPDHVVRGLHPVRTHVEDVAGVGILRDEPERLLLTTATDEDARVGRGDCRRGVERPLELGVLASNGRSSPDHIWCASWSVSSRRSNRSAVPG
jgi:hypothetical protein